VAGAFDDSAEVVEAAGLTSFGCDGSFHVSDKVARQELWVFESGRTLFTTHTTKPFSSILYDSTVSSSLRILPESQPG
jgi:hypothetical protein